MRNPLAILVVLAACGSNHNQSDGAVDGIPPIDSTPLPPCTVTAGSTVSTRQIGRVTGGAVLATSPPNDGRLFVLEQSGRIRIFEGEQLKATPFLDISDNSGGPVVAGGEQGLLGLAFDPNYATNRQFYVWYTGNNPDSTDAHNPFVDVLSRFQVSAADPNVADPTETVVLSVPDFASNHNGGMLVFGPDGMLYVGTGDGGGGGDPDRNGQNPNALLGKILRLDVDHPTGGKPYGIPTDNPFADGVSGAPEVFIMGTRNPWRWSFDRMTGDMWIADVGQNVYEEVDVLKAGAQNGGPNTPVNLGWSMYEANSCYGNYPCSTTGMTFPLDVRDHNTGWNAIIGGEVYRGSCYPDLAGWYFYTDNGFGGMSKARLKTDGTLEIFDLTGNFPGAFKPSSLHGDARGELFETTTDGYVYAVEAGP